MYHGVQWTPDFKKVFALKDLTQINKLTLKTVISEQLNSKKVTNAKNNTKILKLVLLYTVDSGRQGVQR